MKNFRLFLFLLLVLSTFHSKEYPKIDVRSLSNPQPSMEDSKNLSSLHVKGKKEVNSKKIPEKLGLEINQQGHYEIGLYYVTDYESYEVIKNKSSYKLNIFTNFHPLSCDNKSLTLLYGRTQFKLCDITNIKIYWNYNESKESDLFNEHCFILYIKHKGAFLFCSVKIEDKVLMLTLISDYSAFCTTKIRLLSLLNKNGLIRDADDHTQRIKENENPSQIHPTNIDPSNQGQEMMFLHRKTKRQPNNRDFQASDVSNDSHKNRDSQPSDVSYHSTNNRDSQGSDVSNDSRNNRDFQPSDVSYDSPNNRDSQPSEVLNKSPKGRLRYRMLSIKHHDLFITKGYYANIKSPKRFENSFNHHFDKVKIIVTNEGISFIQRKKNNYMRFYYNNFVPPSSEPTRTINVSFSRFLCKFERSLLYLTTKLIDSKLLVDTFFLNDKIMNAYCIRIKECSEDKNVMICLHDQKSFDLLRNELITAIILYHFTMRIEELMNHSNTRKNMGLKLDRFILQNISDMHNRAQIKKQGKPQKFNNRYIVPDTRFRRPIYNGIAFLDDLKKRLKMKVEKRELPFYLNSTLTNNVNNTMPSLEKIMGRDYKKYKDSKDNSDSTQQEENGMNSRGIKKNSNHLKKSHKKVTKKGKKSKGKIKEMSKNLKKIPKKISLNKGKDKMNIVRALAKSKAKKLTRKIFRNNNYMEIYNNRKDIQMDLKSKPLNQIVEEAGII